MFNLLDPDTFWLNVTNIALGIGVLLCCLVLVHGIVQDIRERIASRAHSPLQQDSHTLMIPELGLTMADGGEKLKVVGQNKPETDSSAKKN